MKAKERREFVQKLSGLGLLGLASALSVPTARGVEVSPRIRAARDKLMAQMETNLGIAVPPVDGRFLDLLVQALNAQRVLEIGTYRGYSGIWIGRALERTGGKLLTIDIDPARVKESRTNFATAGLSDRITVIEGDGHEVAAKVEGAFDMVFLDADKGGEVDYFAKLFAKLRAGGLVVVHNAISFKEAMKPYLDMVETHPGVVSIIVSASMQDGMSVTLKQRD